MTWIQRLRAFFFGAPPAPPLRVIVPQIPPKPAALPPTARLEDWECLWLVHHNQRVVAWGLDRKQAMDNAWSWGQRNHETHAMVSVIDLRVRRGEILTVLGFMEVHIFPDGPNEQAVAA